MHVTFCPGQLELPSLPLSMQIGNCVTKDCKTFKTLWKFSISASSVPEAE